MKASSEQKDKGSVLVVDDEEVMRDVLQTLLEEEGYSVQLVGTGKEALGKAADGSFELVLLDLMLPDTNGIEVLKELHQLDPHLSVVIITAFGTVEKAVKALKEGAFNFITKPFKNDEILQNVANGIEKRRLTLENLQLKANFKQRYDFHNIIGKSARMQAIFDFITHVGPSRSTVLIYGESGTGKELVARAIHVCSPRSDQAFIAVNCGNIPNELLESELFGHVKGAFTGAASTKKGLFEMAHAGSIFLDEIGSISFEMQAKLLRVLQEREFRRLGGLESIRVDVRIIAATNQDLKLAVNENRFRDDLYYRLNVINITLPPLQERKEDIPLLTTHFIKKYNAENNREIIGVDEEAMKVLMEHDWPGNVRELENVIERAVVLTAGSTIIQDSLPKSIFPGPENENHLIGDFKHEFSLKFEVENYERNLILKALQQSDGNQKRAAQILRINATTLNEKIKRLHIRTK